MNEERLQILKLLEGGKISSEEAARLLQVVETGPDKPASVGTAGPSEWLRVRVVDKGGAEKVNVNLPLALLGVVAKMVPRRLLEAEGIDLDIEAIIQAIRDGARGKLVEVQEADGGLVEVVVE